MKRAIFFLLLISVAVSACEALRDSQVADPSASISAAPEASAPPRTAASSVQPAATFNAIPAPTATPTPTQFVPLSPRADCNIAELVAQGLQPEDSPDRSQRMDFSLVLHLTNLGSCTWTTDYKFVLAHSQGLQVESRQEFSTYALPGDTVELPVRFSIPTQDGVYHAVWLIEDPIGDIFGTGMHRDQLIHMQVLLNGSDPVIIVNEWLFPSERCEGQPREFRLPSFARLKHDPQWMPWPSRMLDPEWNHQFHDDWYPETVPLWTNPAGGDGRLPYSREWLEFLRALQPNDEAAVWIARIAAGLFNKGNDFIPILDLRKLDQEPVAESISSGGNVVRLMEFRNGAARIQMLYFKDPIPSPAAVNYFTTPWLVTKFTSVSKDGELGNAGGIDVYFPNLAKQPEGYWVDLNRIEFFPVLPRCATVEYELSVYAQASVASPRVGYLAPGQEILIRDYLPQGSDVWGRFRDGWVRLEFQRDGQPFYPTSWEMETRPPIHFR